MQYSGCYVIMLEKVSQNTVAWTQTRRWCFYNEQQQQPMEKLYHVRSSPQKHCVSCTNKLHPNGKKSHCCRGMRQLLMGWDEDPRALDSLSATSGPSYKVS